MHNIAKTFFPILLLLFAVVVTAQNEKNNIGNAQDRKSTRLNSSHP